MFLDLGHSIDDGLISTIDLTMEFGLFGNKCRPYMSILIFSFEVCGPCVV